MAKSGKGQGRRGHPDVYDREALTPIICEQLSRGIPLLEVCRAPGMPDATAVYAWAKRDEALAQRIACAREVGAEAIVERLRKTARGLKPDQGGESTGDVQRDKLIVDTDMRLLAKWFPQRYGDKVALTNASGTGDATLRVETVLVDQLVELINAQPLQIVDARDVPEGE